MSNVQEIVLSQLEDMHIHNVTLHHNLTPTNYEQFILQDPENQRSSLGAVMIKTGKFTGRSPKDRYVVLDNTTEKTVDWGHVNQEISDVTFDILKSQIKNYLSDKTVFVHDAYACADPKYRLNIRTIAEKAYSALFASNMFRNFEQNSEQFKQDWTILCAPDFKADPSEFEDLPRENFAILNFAKKEIIIGGTGYTGEIKKGIFSVLNYLLPQKDVLPMHCSANVDKDGQSAIFFGLSGTGKTTLSADPERLLIGDDEHGWSNEGIFNFEGGCYAKTINLSKEGEPQIYNAIKAGAILENQAFLSGSSDIDFANTQITENTRVSYPLEHIPEAKDDSQAGHPEHIFFLTCDAFGVLPPVSKLSKEQAMYYFISGYTAKVAGTELGINEPQATFSACFGSPFLPLHPGKYAEMLGDKMEQHNTKIWLVNTGWTGGSYGVGARISLKHTRAIISSILNGELEDVSYEKIDGFLLDIPQSCPNVPANILNPRNTWSDKEAYDDKAQYLIELFHKNFLQYSDLLKAEIKNAAPEVLV